MWILNHRRSFYAFSALLLAACVAAIVVWGLKPSIEFTGGTLVEARYGDNAPTQSELIKRLDDAGFAGSSVRAAGDEGSYIVRTRPVTETERQNLIAALNQGSLTVDRLNSVGPTLGAELVGKAATSVILVVIAIILYVALAFRAVGKPVSSWTYGLITIAAFAHDVLIPLGAFAILGHFAGIEVDTLFVTALLVVLGYSINDTIVIFDRIRENLKRAAEKGSRGEEFEGLVGRSLSETVGRSFNTSTTTLLAIIVLFFVGSVSTKMFALALGLGVIAGTYSSIFLAAPLLVTIAAWSAKRAASNK